MATALLCWAKPLRSKTCGLLDRVAQEALIFCSTTIIRSYYYRLLENSLNRLMTACSISDRLSWGAQSEIDIGDLSVSSLFSLFW
jgi:hypothetical protein